ncbi:hydroxymethylbilane synthase [Falsarthrobacter nasiphocae]|uniref:Porphobilinogen deaminase n=1 Tax=Falsarthrobacter nasiphocae TaxID=189863 RepID=A0AAE4C5V0_9MICC|nr:hydroxymethylbilane synthase [Falsarthrobacter nasiphocae]MDR6891457.1 hydroxymethylbilane synthase [Falsarthrobacter nasiphocae]
MTGGFRLATRGSALARTQSGMVLDALAERSGLPGELILVKTEGDVVTTPLAQLGGTGVFVSAVRQALAAQQADVAVHSLKDLPTAPEPGFRIGAVPEREDVRDALCARDGLTLETLPEGASVGTGSPRRAAQLLAVRPDLTVVAIRGNVDTRLSRVKGVRLTDESNQHMSGGLREDLDAVVLAAAGLKRLGRESHITELIAPELMLPAPGQGALAVEVRDSDDERTAALAEALAAYDHAPTRLAVTAERALLSTLEAGCSAPVGALAVFEDGRLTLEARAVRTDGSEVFSGGASLELPELAGDEAEAAAFELGVVVAEALIERGAGDLI